MRVQQTSLRHPLRLAKSLRDLCRETTGFDIGKWRSRETIAHLLGYPNWHNLTRMVGSSNSADRDVDDLSEALQPALERQLAKELDISTADAQTIIFRLRPVGRRPHPADWMLDVCVRGVGIPVWKGRLVALERTAGFQRLRTGVASSLFYGDILPVYMPPTIRDDRRDILLALIDKLRDPANQLWTGLIVSLLSVASAGFHQFDRETGGLKGVRDGDPDGVGEALEHASADCVNTMAKMLAGFAGTALITLLNEADLSRVGVVATRGAWALLERRLANDTNPKTCRKMELWAFCAEFRRRQKLDFWRNELHRSTELFLGRPATT